MSHVRPRSVSRERVTTTGSLGNDDETLDPMKIIEPLVGHIQSLDIPLAVKLTDGNKTVVYLLSVFTQKNWPISEGYVKFGITKLKLDSLKVNISFDVEIVQPDPTKTESIT